MSLLESTKFFLREAEHVSGRPVVVQEDPALPTLATNITARGAAPMHILKYRPVPNQRPDYHICYQCGFIIRLFENDPEHRFSMGLSPEGPKRMESWLKEGPAMPQAVAAKDHILGSLMIQLRTISVGLRIDELIWARYPELRDEQLASARLQMSDNIKGLVPAIRQAFPKKVVQANTAMNAAFALFWSEKLEDPTLRLPYQSVGAEGDGQELMKVFSSLGTGAPEDCNLVDTWADRLGLRGCYKWIRHELE